MSKGISWRQRIMLVSIGRRTMRTRPSLVDGQWVQTPVAEPVAWRDIDYGPTASEQRPDFSTPRVQWNLEQVTRRALRSLEQRGLVELGRYAFVDEPIINGRRWTRIDRDDHAPSRGDSRIMTGALLTAAGWAEIRYEISIRPVVRLAQP